MYENLMSKNTKFEFSPNKEDMFATGMVLLELGIQESLQNVYRKEGKFNHDAMKAYVARFEEIYSGHDNQLLVTAILTMLEPHESRRPHFILLHERMPSYYSIVKYFEKLREDPSLNQERLLETFIYVEQTSIEAFTLQPGIKQIKVFEGNSKPKNNVDLNHKYSNRYIGTSINDVNNTNNIKSGKLVERIIRRFEERDGLMIEKVEHFRVLEDDQLLKIQEYELINSKKCHVKHFDHNSLGSTFDDIKRDDKGHDVDLEVQILNEKQNGNSYNDLSKSIEKHKKGNFSYLDGIHNTHHDDHNYTN
jgi:hypothetical protein